jgi:glyoxylase-like metal-dependent hydrolase (beta-lactamase superfamily II)
MIELGAYRLDLISDGFFEDDADTFVTLCVEQESSPQVKVRAKPRIKVGFNSLLIRGGGHAVVVDPGTGDKPRAGLVNRYNMEWPRRFFPALTELGVPVDEVDKVVLTHLHWDHSGGATRIGDRGEIVPTFPRATYHVQRIELETARRLARSGDDSYLPEDFEPLVSSDQLQLLDGDVKLFDGVEVRLVGGHTPGLQVVVIGDKQRGGAIYLSDLVPTGTQIPLDCVLSYDSNIEELKISKRKILAEAALQHDLLLFVHAPRLRAGYLRYLPDGKHELNPVTV